MSSEREPAQTPRQTGDEPWPSGPGGTPMIEGSFSHDSLPDLFRFVCARQRSFAWQLSTLAGTFTLSVEAGTPVDIIFNPARPVGAKVGIRALRMLFQQEGGRFRLWADPPAQPRRTLHTTGEQLLIELATLDDEALAPAVLSGRQVNVEAELALVSDMPPPDHRTAFRTRTADVPLTEVLQLFSVSRQPSWVQLRSLSDTLIGRLHLNARHEVVSAEYQTADGGQKLSGPAAFSALLTHPEPGTVDVRPLPQRERLALEELKDAPAPLGPLDALLMRELLSGRLGSGQAPIQDGTGQDDPLAALGPDLVTPGRPGPPARQDSEKTGPVAAFLGRFRRKTS